MGLIEIASGNSVWRGMGYYQNKKVSSWNKTGEIAVIGKDGIITLTCEEKPAPEQYEKRRVYLMLSVAYVVSFFSIYPNYTTNFR